MADRDLVFRVGGYTGMDYVMSLILPERRMALRVARAAYPGSPRVIVVMPSRAAYLVEEGRRVAPTASPALPF
jgi:hypothetical protein